MHSYYRFSLLILSLFLLLSCEKDTAEPATGEVVLQFKGTFGSDPLLMYAADYPYEAGMDLKFQLFQFYLSDIVLLGENKTTGDSVVLSDIELVSFKDIQTADAAQQGVQLRIKNVPQGRYRGIKFGLGVSPDLNATSPAAYTPPHPLDDNYWSWATGYVFTKIEGNADLNADGIFETKLTFHAGGNSYYRQQTYLRDLTVASGENTLQFSVDLERVLKAGAGNFLDFRQVQQDHTNNPTVAAFISDNLKQAVKLQ